VIVGFVGSPDVIEVLQLRFDGNHDLVEHGDFVRGAIQSPFGAGAIVALDVDDQRVVELALVFNLLDDAADFVVGVGRVGSEHVYLAQEHFLLVGSQLVPVLEQVRRPGRHLGVRWNHAQFFLVREDLLAQIIPALVEQVHVADLLSPFGRRVMRCVGSTRHIVDKERLLRTHRVDAHDWVLKKDDEVWPCLRIWVDDNPRDGVVQPSELHKPEEFGIFSITLIPEPSPKKDQWGNSFAWGGELNVKPEEVRERAQTLHEKAYANRGKGEGVNTQSYDVWLVNSEIGK
jgi:hypothetical protein